MNQANSTSDGGGRRLSHHTARRSLQLIRAFWVPLAITDIAFKILTFVVLMPIVAVLFRLFVEFSGRKLLADADILIFFVSPTGWLCFVIVGGCWSAIFALEQAALLRILHQKRSDARVSALDAMRFSLSHGRLVLWLTARIAALTLLTVLPFVAVAVAVYLSLLNEFDINYYLAEPPVFLIAIACGVVIGSVLAFALLRLFSGWLLTLPLVLFEGRDAAQSMRESRASSRGHRIRMISWVMGWALVTMLVSALGTGASGWLGQFMVNRATSSIPFLLLVVGAMVVVWSALSFFVHLISTTSFSALILALYNGLGRDEQAETTSNFAAEPDNASGIKLTWKRLLLAGAAAVVCTMALGGSMLTSIKMRDETQVTAHRGASTVAPENTMAAVRAALQQGADWVEIDVQETADGHVVVFHDSDFKRLAGSDLKIWDATLGDLKDLDIGGRFAAEFKDQRVPTLEEVLVACKGKAGVNIELKYYGHEARLEERVIEVVEAQQMESDVVFMSLKLSAVQKMKRLRPKWRVGLLAGTAMGSLNRVEADFLAVSAGIASRRFIQDAHNRGKQVHVWTINDPITMSTMIGRGVDNLITDNPGLALAVLEERSKLGFPERVLLGVADIFGVTPKFSTQ